MREKVARYEKALEHYAKRCDCGHGAHSRSHKYCLNGDCMCNGIHSIAREALQQKDN